MLLTAALPAQTAPPPGSDRLSRLIVVPTPTNNYPNSFLDESGHCVGFSVDLLDAVARVSDLKLLRQEGPKPDDRMLITTGQADLLQAYTYEQSRESYVDFSASYLVLQGAFFAHQRNASIRTIEDLNGREVIIVGAGSTGDRFLRDHHVNAKVTYLRTGEEAVRLLDAGQHDALFLTRLTALSVIEKFGLKNVRTLAVPAEGYDVRLCFAVRKGDAQLLARLNEGLAILHRTGEFDRIYNRWYGRLEPRRFSRGEVVSFIAAALGLALLITLWAFVRQRQLRQRLGRQAAELAESRAILAEAQRFAKLGHWQRSRGEEARVLWSEETFRIFERDPAAGPPSDLESIIGNAREPDRERWRATVDEALRTGEPYSLDVTIEPRPGVRKVIHLQGRGTRDTAGHLNGIFGTVQDVTAARAAETAWRESEQLLRALFDNLPYGLGVFERIEREWVVLSVNPSTMRHHGLTAPPATGSPIDELELSDERRTSWAALMDRAVDRDEVVQIERHDPAKHRDFALTIVPLTRTDGPPRCYSFAEDITDRKQKDAEIGQSRRLRAVGELVGGIAHEFNNLLTPILLKTEMLRADWAHLPALRGELQLIAEAAQRSAELTRRLLAFGRKTERQPESFDVHTAVASDVDLIRHTFDRRIEIATAVPAGLPPLWLCAGDFHQILINLLLNARDTLMDRLARPQPPGWTACIQVVVTALPSAAVAPILGGGPADLAGWHRLTVRDNGTGIAPDVLERIYEPFFTTKEVGHGTGLGLATVWHLVTEMGGRIEVDSAPGVGSAFHVYLPQSAARPSSAALKPAPPPPAGPATLRRHLLVVEDEEVIARLVTTIIKREGHDCTVVANGLAAWERLSATPGFFDAVIMDLNLPGISGLEFARRARALPYERPLLVMSGRVTESDRLELARLRIDTQLGKPFTLEAFVAALRSLSFHSAP